MILITSGDSFSECTTGYVDTWPIHIKNLLGCDHISKAVEGQSNGLIAKSIVYEVNQQIHHGVASSDIIVGIMWSTPSRWEFYDEYKKHKIKTSIENTWFNPTNFIEQDNGGWYILNIQNNHPFVENFYKDYYTEFSGYIATLEYIFYTQLFLEKHKIKYFMSYWEPDCFPNKIKTNPGTDYLYNMIDWNKFVSKESQLSWLEKIKGAHVLTRHPKSDEHKRYVDEVMFPHLQKNILNVQ
jgi:hypothetical protein